MENFTINRKNKSFVFDDGEEIPIPKDKEKEVLRSPYARSLKSKEKEFLSKASSQIHPLAQPLHTFKESAQESFLGNLPQTAINYLSAGTKAITPGEGQEEIPFLDRVLDNFYALQDARKEYLSEQGEQSPVASTLGTIMGMGGELAALGKVPAGIGLPIMGAGHSETSFLEPGKKIPELSKDALIGVTLDKFFKGIGNVAGHRETRRGIQEAIKQAEDVNAQEIARAAQATEAEQARFAQETAKREADIASLPALQKAENEAWAEQSAQQIEKVGNTLGTTPIEASVLGVEDFVENSIERSAQAGSKEGNFVSRFLKSVFKGDKSGKMSADNLKKGFRALDEAIATQEGAAKELLGQFRNELIETLPGKISNAYVYEKWAPKIASNAISGAEKQLSGIISKSPQIQETLVEKLGSEYLEGFVKEVKQTIHGILEKNRANFAESLQKGTIQNEIEQAIRSSPAYNKINKTIDSFFPGFNKSFTYQNIPGYEAIDMTFKNYPQKIADRAAKAVEKYMPDIALDMNVKSGVADRSLAKIPQQPNLIPQPAPVSPAQTIAPNLQPVPQMPQAQGLYGRLAEGLEGVQGAGLKGGYEKAKELAPMGLMAKLAGIPLAKGVALTSGALKGAEILTRPGAAANAVRMTFKQGGIAAVDAWMQSYPSYHDGILENPEERRSINKEIEEASDIPIEKKAVMQSKVNRGKPLQDRL